MNHNIAAIERTEYRWLVTDTVWDRDPILYAMIARTAAEMRWASATNRLNTAALHRDLASDHLYTGLVAAAGASSRTLWIGRAKAYATKPVPHTLTGIREITAEGTRSLLMLTESERTVPVAVCEQAILGPAIGSPCTTARHWYCPGQGEDGRACNCRCGCRWPDRLTIYRNLICGDTATDPAWQWPFTVTADPEPDEHGGLSIEVRGDDEQVSELVFRAPTEPVIIHNAWRPARNAPPAAGPEPPA